MRDVTPNSLHIEFPGHFTLRVGGVTTTRFIRRCRDDGQTVVFSTHIMSEVEMLCDRIALM